MKKIKINLLCSLSVLTLISCKKTDSEGKEIKSFEELEKISWLIGSWSNTTPDGILTETWSKVNDSTYSGKSYFIKGKDTLHSESIELIQNNDELFYIPTVKGQNNDKAITFKLSDSNEKDFVFENPTHDYPQKITYSQITKDSLVATISGKQHGKESSESYPMKRK
jgi:hypothetical protein